MSNSNQEQAEILNIIESALDLAGTGSKQVILDYLKIRYGTKTDFIVRYKEEFTDYLKEVLSDGAGIIAARINQTLEEYVSSKNLQHSLCYICNRSYSPEEMRHHLMYDHKKEEIAHHLAVIYVNDWREENQLRDESNSMLSQVMHN